MRAEDLDLPSVSCSEEAGVRYLHLGDTPWVQGCMRVRKPLQIELGYVQRMLACCSGTSPPTALACKNCILCSWVWARPV